MQWHNSVIMISCGDDHGGVLLGTPSGGSDIVYWAVWIDIGKVICIVWVAIVTSPRMSCSANVVLVILQHYCMQV